VTNGRGWATGPLLAQWLAWSAISLISCTVNVLSILHEADRQGEAIVAWKPWLYEMSSFAGWSLTLLLLLPWNERMAGRSLALPVRLACYAAASLAFSALHVGMMVGLRKAVFWMTGGFYDFGRTAPEFLYEYRKDLVSFLVVVGVALFWRSRPRPPILAAAAAEPAFLVPGRDGEVLVRAGEIDWIEAQGNYVALHVGGQERLLRQPLKEIEAKLADMAFIRTHRSALVNLRRVKGITRTELGEVRVEFANRDSAPLSASRRAEVVRALAAG